MVYVIGKDRAFADLSQHLCDVFAWIPRCSHAVVVGIDIKGGSASPFREELVKKGTEDTVGDPGKQ